MYINHRCHGVVGLPSLFEICGAVDAWWELEDLLLNIGNFGIDVAHEKTIVHSFNFITHEGRTKLRAYSLVSMLLTGWYNRSCLFLSMTKMLLRRMFM